MLINRIFIDGFRNILDTTIDFSNITALVGLNNFGKTNFIAGIEFAFDFIRLSSKTKSRLMASEGDVPINTMTANRDFAFEIEFITDIKGKEVVVVYSFSFEWIKNDEKGSFIKSEVLQIKEYGKNKFSNFIKRDGKDSFYKPSETGRCSAKIDVKPNELIINKLKHYDNIIFSEIIDELSSIEIDCNTFYDTRSTFVNLPFRPNLSYDYKLEKPLGFNIAEVVYQLKKDYPDKYELLINSFTSLIPSIEMLEVISFDVESKNELKFEDMAPFKKIEKFYRIRVKETHNNQATNFEDLSGGTKRLFLLITSAIQSEIQNVPLITFEELENCVHPYLFQRLLILLTDLVKNCRILVTSHSPYLIQYLDLDQIYIGLPSKEGVATFKRINKSKQKSLYKNAINEGISTGDYIFNMLVERYEDFSELQSYLI